MSNLYFNQQVSPRIYKTKTAPAGKSQRFFYENHLEERLKELDNTQYKILENMETLKHNQLDHNKQHQYIQNKMDHLFSQLARELSDITSQIIAVKKMSAAQNDNQIRSLDIQRALLESIDEKQAAAEKRSQSRFKELVGKLKDLKNHVVETKSVSIKHTDTYQENVEAQSKLLQALDERQIKIESGQLEEIDLTRLLFQKLNEKISEITPQIAEIVNLSTQQTETLLENHEVEQALLQSIDERQVNMEASQHEDIDLTQLLYQELNQKINELPPQINEIINVSTNQADTLIEHHVLQQAMLQAIDERQLKIEQNQRDDMNFSQSFYQEINEKVNSLNDSYHRDRASSQNM